MFADDCVVANGQVGRPIGDTTAGPLAPGQHGRFDARL
jgi:hypothetical protein